MFYGKKIKQLEERVATLEARVQTLETTVKNQTNRIEAQLTDIYKLYIDLVRSNVEKSQQAKISRKQQKKNGKNTEAGK